jgi:UrcA family protein
MSQVTTIGRAGSRGKLALMLLGSLAGIGAFGAAGAATPDSGAPSLVVRYTEQSLATDGGVNQLYRRIASAAAKVCPDVSIHDLGAMRQVQQCRNEAIARAIGQINNSRLAALYASRSKNS